MNIHVHVPVYSHCNLLDISTSADHCGIQMFKSADVA